MFLGNLYPSQIKAAEFLVNKKKVLLAWEQGSGKTIISLASTEKLFEKSLAKTCLVLAPTSIGWQWREKIGDFTESSVHQVVAGNPTQRRGMYGQLSMENRYLIVPYSLFRSDYDAIVNCHFDIVICDEAQEFKNNQSKTAKLLKSYNNSTGATTYRWALTGTAISNKLEELYSIFYWIDKEFLPVWPKFEQQHIVRSNYTNAIIKYKNLKELNEHLIKRMDRKTHKDLQGQLPELVHQFYSVKKSDEYSAAESSLIDSLDTMAKEIQFTEQGDLYGAPAQVRKQFAAVQQTLYTPKLRTILSLVENLSGKLVLFSHHKDILYKLRDHYREQAVLFTGDQTSEEKQAAIRRFSMDTRLLLCSDAGNSGLDLPFASHVIHLNVPFSWSVLDQRNKRITRLSSEFKTVVAHYILIEDSIEQYFYNQVIRKGVLASAALEGTADEVIVKPQSLRQYLNDSKKDRGVLQT